MSRIRKFDKIVSQKVYKLCVDKGYEKYTEIAIILNTSDTFVKGVFSEYRKKLNLYHLLRIAYALGYEVTENKNSKNKMEDFFNAIIPTEKDYMLIYPNMKDQEESFIKSIEE